MGSSVKKFSRRVGETAKQRRQRTVWMSLGMLSTAAMLASHVASRFFWFFPTHLRADIVAHLSEARKHLDAASKLIRDRFTTGGKK